MAVTLGSRSARRRWNAPRAAGSLDPGERHQRLRRLLQRRRAGTPRRSWARSAPSPPPAGWRPGWHREPWTSQTISSPTATPSLRREAHLDGDRVRCRRRSPPRAVPPLPATSLSDEHQRVAIGGAVLPAQRPAGRRWSAGAAAAGGSTSPSRRRYAAPDAPSPTRCASARSAPGPMRGAASAGAALRRRELVGLDVEERPGWAAPVHR